MMLPWLRRKWERVWHGNLTLLEIRRPGDPLPEDCVENDEIGDALGWYSLVFPHRRTGISGYTPGLCFYPKVREHRRLYLDCLAASGWRGFFYANVGARKGSRIIEQLPLCRIDGADAVGVFENLPEDVERICDLLGKYGYFNYDFGAVVPPDRGWSSEKEGGETLQETLDQLFPNAFDWLWHEPERVGFWITWDGCRIDSLPFPGIEEILVQYWMKEKEKVLRERGIRDR